MKYMWLLCIALFSVAFISCNKEDEYFNEEYQSVPIVIKQIYLEDYESAVPDRPVEFARLGQLIRVEGSGLFGMKKVYINGYDTYFNRAYITDNSMLIQINVKTPVVDADSTMRNKIRFVKDKAETTYDFLIRAASPTVTGLNLSLPMPGETVVVSGTNLHETVKVTLPGDVVLEGDAIKCDPDGEWYSFEMPKNVKDGGYILSEGAHGFAQTPACFNEKRGMLLDFDGTGVQGGWSATYMPEDLTDDPLESGRGKVVPAVPASVIAEGGINKGANGKGWFTAGGEKGAWSDPTEDWTRFYKFIPADTPVANFALQFDVYVPEEWSTGMLEFTFQNNLSNYGYGSTETTNTTNIEYPMAVVWVPWLTPDGGKVPYKTEGWQTITIPINTVGKYQNTEADLTFATLCADRAVASYANFGMFLVNNDVKFSEEIVHEASVFQQMVYVDNWRLVPYESVVVSDYPEEEEEASAEAVE